MSLLPEVKQLFNDNHKVGSLGGLKYDYTCPSPKYYPHQYLWDSSFHAIVLTNFDLERAKKEMETLFQNQSEDGFVPCVTIWKKRNPFESLFYATGITQPPVAPISAEIIYEKSRDINFVRRLYPKLKKFTDWFYKNRDINQNGLIEVIHPWETGIDSSPTFDKQLEIKKPNPGFIELIAKYFLILHLGKKFRSENVLVNSIYTKSLKSMSYLAKILGKVSDAEVFSTRYKQTLEALIKYCWSEKDGIFYDLDQNNKQVRIKTIASLMPLILDDLPKRYAGLLIRHLIDKKEFWSEYPIPSVAMDEVSFSSGGGFVLWRGPTWINTNWFIAKALIKKGFKKEAKVIREKTSEMIERYGFWEYYNPLTGKGYGQKNFGWSALVVDMTS